MNLQVSRPEAATELLKRRSIRASLTEWCRLCGFEPAEHHQLLIRELEAVARGETRRLAFFLPPGSAKSTYGSVLFPPWLMQSMAGNVLAASHTTELAEKWGRRVRNLVTEHSLVLGIQVAADNQAAGRWALTTGSEYYAAGVGTGIAGFRAKLGIIDDPIRSRQDADSELIRDRIWDWYINDFRTRLVPGAAEILIQCLTGDTLIALADGSQKRLDDISVGDRVLSWDGEKAVGSLVGAIIDNGPDQTYLIRTKTADVRANARHPFLVLSDDGLRWIRTKDLRNGMRIVRLGEGLTKALRVPQKGVTSQRSAGECALATIARLCGRRGIGRLLSAARGACLAAVSGAMASISQNLTAYSQSRMAFAPYAGQMVAKGGQGIGLRTSSPIITTKQGRFAASYATTATGSLDELEIPPSWNVPSSTFEPDTDEVVSITPHGIERVYDLTVNGTHNFVANGFWSHNTRWHEDDLAGRALQHDDWRVISLPAIAEENDQLGRKVGEPLWNDDSYGYGGQIEEIRSKTPARTWSALYQQRPVPEDGDYFKAEWLKPYDKPPARDTLRIYGGSDYAVTADGGDFTCHAVVGLDPEGRMYLLDLWRKQAASDEWVEAFCDLVVQWKPMAWAEEQGQIKAGVGPFLDRRQRERRAYVVREQFPTRGDKAVRAQSIRGRMALEGLYVPVSAPWYAELRRELLSFPAGKHDDQVDALGLVGQLLDRMMSGQKPKAPVKKADPSGYRDREREAADNDWTVA